MQAVVVNPRSTVGVAFGRRDEPVPTTGEALVRVSTISLNPGELKSRALLESPGWRPGRDFAGIVEQSAVDGSGPAAGTRVVGLVNGGAFAELVAAPTCNLASISPAVSFSDAATLPVAGLTALFALERFGALAGRKVLVTGANGGVGQFGVQIARASGASVTAAVRDPRHADTVQALGADEVIVAPELQDRADTYDFALETVGGQTIPLAMASLVRGGTCIAIGNLGGNQSTVDLVGLLTRGLSLIGLYLFDELSGQRGSQGLGRLANFVEDGRVRPYIGLQGSWTEIEEHAAKMLNREVTGKVVLHLVS